MSDYKNNNSLNRLNKNIIIYPHTEFNLSNGGIVVQYYLANILDSMEINVKICNVYDKNAENILFNKFITIDEINSSIDFENTIIIYCEGVIGNPLKGKYIVRWMLSKLGVNVPFHYINTWDNNELVYFFNSEIDIIDNKSNIKYLSLFYINPIFENKNLDNRNDVCFTRRKEISQYTEIHNKETSFEITREHTQNEYLDIFNNHKLFISYDPLTFLSLIAIKCGCISVIYPVEGVSKKDYFKTTALYDYMIEKNIDSIYGIAYGNSDDEINYAKTTLHLFEEQLIDINNWFIKKYVNNFINDINNWNNCNNILLNYKNMIKENLLKDPIFINFDINFYRNHYNDLKTLELDDINLLNHYKTWGKNEGRISSKRQLDELIASTGEPDFDINFYKSYHSDLNHMYEPELIYHYNNWGKNEGRISSQKQLDELIASTGEPNFDINFYKKFYKDLSYMHGLQLINHYKLTGKKEGRFTSKKQLYKITDSTGKYVFDINFYKSYHSDLRHLSKHELINHYINWGKKEGRIICQDQLNELYISNGNFDPEFVTSDKKFEIVNDKYFKYNFTVGEDLNINNISNINNNLIYNHIFFRKIDNFTDLLKYNKKYIKKYYFFNKECFYKYYNGFDYEYYKNRYFKDNNEITENEVLTYFHTEGKNKKHIINNKITIIMYSPPYDINCGGILVMHYLVKLINERYNDKFHAKLFMHNNIRYKNPFCNDFARIDEINDNTIVIYPEIISGNPLNAKNVVRWILLDLGIEMPLDHYKKWGLNDLVYYWESKQNSKNLKQLNCQFMNPLFKNSNNTERIKTCYLVKKGQLIHKKINYIHPPDSKCIDGLSLKEINHIFNECKYFYSYDPNSAHIIHAAVCGCIPIIYPIDGMSSEEYFNSRMYNYKNIIHNKGIVYSYDLNKINFILENKLNENNEEYYKNLFNLFQINTISNFIEDINLYINQKLHLDNNVGKIFY